MAYEKNTWQSGDVVTSAKLNNIENGIANCNGLITCTYDVEKETLTLSVSYNDVLRMINTGIFPFILEEVPDDNSLVLIKSYGIYNDRYFVETEAHVFFATSADELLVDDAK